jgi:hypothetical protein
MYVVKLLWLMVYDITVAATEVLSQPPWTNTYKFHRWPNTSEQAEIVRDDEYYGGFAGEGRQNWLPQIKEALAQSGGELQNGNVSVQKPCAAIDKAGKSEGGAVCVHYIISILNKRRAWN